MMEMDEALEKALQRVVNEENLKYIPQLEEVLTLAQQKERILAAEILGGLATTSCLGHNFCVLKRLILFIAP